MYLERGIMQQITYNALFIPLRTTKSACLSPSRFNFSSLTGPTTSDLKNTCSYNLFSIYNLSMETDIDGNDFHRQWIIYILFIIQN